MLILKKENWKAVLCTHTKVKVGVTIKSLLNRVRLWTPLKLSNVWGSDHREAPDLWQRSWFCIITVPLPTVTEQGLPSWKRGDAPQNWEKREYRQLRRLFEGSRDAVGFWPGGCDCVFRRKVLVAVLVKILSWQKCGVMQTPKRSF